ncbi:ATP-binding protein, partial [Amycolatopsis mediterranei]
ELLENATRFSPPEHKVALTADRGADGGLLIEVVDQGLGMTPAELATVNARLAAAGTVGPETTRRMGLFVVGRLAALHGVTVRLRATGAAGRHAGVTASVHVPGALVLADLARPIGAGRLAPAGRNGHTRPPVVPVVPAQASTPIFEQVVTSWFTEPPAKPVVRRNGAKGPAQWPAAGERSEEVSEPEENPAAEPPAAHRAPDSPAATEAAVNRIASVEAEWPGGAEGSEVHGAESAASTVDRIAPVEGARAETRAVHGTGSAEPADRIAPVEAGWPSRAETPAAHRAAPAEQTAFAEAASRTHRAETAPAHAADPTLRSAPTPVGEWDTPADRTRQAAESALKPPAAQNLTDAGLPTRRPGAQLAPGAVVPRVREQAGGTFRDAAAVRSSLSRHYQGMRAARLESAARTEQSGKDEVDPR